MQNKRSLLCFISILTLISCGKKQVDMDILCEQTENEDFIIRWDIYPSNLNKDVQILGSYNETDFTRTSIVDVPTDRNIVKIDGIGGRDNYRFFKIKAGNNYSLPFSSRYYQFDNVLNFRDIGGYKTTDGEEIRWRRVFRSGSLSNATTEDVQRLNNIGIKTIIDLRSAGDIRLLPTGLSVENVFQLPLTSLSQAELISLIMQQYLSYEDAVVYLQEIYLDIALKNKDLMAQMLDILLDSANYPILFTCEQGKDQTGLVIYTLMRVLDVYQNFAEDDFLLSNVAIDKDKLFQRFKSVPLSESQQFAISLLGKTDISSLRYTSREIRKIYGSYDNYIQKGLSVTPEKKEYLKSLLLVHPTVE